MPRTSQEITADAQKLKKLIPAYADSPQALSSAHHAERHGDKKALVKDRRIGTHLLRLENLLGHDGVESRAWDSAVRELVIDKAAIPESYWRQQLQILRDNGSGELTHLSQSTKDHVTEQLQDAQLTGLDSWRTYLEQTGDQYPLWFKLYAWEGMSGLGVFDQQKKQFRKRSTDTVAPYPQLNPAVLAQVYDTVTQNEKNESFNALYSRILLEQKASIPTPENPEDVHGEWREYTASDIEAINSAAQATPWCIAGRHYAKSYTNGGAKFILFHLQDQETGVYSPTACASIRLDGKGRVVELSGLRGGSSQYLEDGVVPTVQEKVKALPGGEEYLQAFEDKQMLIAMDKKYRAGDLFTIEELLFLYEVDRPIQYLDTYEHDPRPDEFKHNRSVHISQLAEHFGGNKANAELILKPIEDGYKASSFIRRAVENGVDPDFLVQHLNPMVTLKNVDYLSGLGIHVDVDELAAQIPRLSLLGWFTKLKDHGLTMTANELGEMFSDSEKATYFSQLKAAGLELTPDELAARFDDAGKIANLVELRRIGATFNVDELVVRKYGTSETIGLNKNGIPAYNMRYLLSGGASPMLILDMLKMAKTQDEELYGEGGVYAHSAVIALGYILDAVPESGMDQSQFIDRFYQKLRSNSDTFVGEYGGGRHSFKEEFLLSGFDVNVVAYKLGVDDSDLDEFIRLGVDRNVVVEAMVSRYVPKGGAADTYTLSQSIDRLTDYGCDIADIASHITPKYQFDQFATLQKHGAKLNLNQVVAAMPPKDVISRIARINQKGVKVDINVTLRGAVEGDVYEFMVEDLVAAGADNALIADKLLIRPKDVNNYGHYQGDRYFTSIVSQYPGVHERVKARMAEIAKHRRDSSK